MLFGHTGNFYEFERQRKMSILLRTFFDFFVFKTKIFFQNPALNQCFSEPAGNFLHENAKISMGLGTTFREIASKPARKLQNFLKIFGNLTLIFRAPTAARGQAGVFFESTGNFLSCGTCFSPGAPKIFKNLPKKQEFF